jgi:exodeoxyribonuclease VII small subunit
VGEAAPAAPDPTGPEAGNPGTGDAGLGYEQARAALDDVVRRLESGGLSLEESLALWERGERLADVCQAWLDGARQRLDTALHPPADAPADPPPAAGGPRANGGSAGANSAAG